MLVLKLWNYFKGYVIIKIKGSALERFINLTIFHEIPLWDVVKIDSNVIEAKISIQEFKNIRHIARKTKSRVFIIKKRGLPFLLIKLLKRKFFLFGILLFFIIQYGLSSIIWDIEVIGIENIGKQDIVKNIENLGLKVGTFKCIIDPKYIEDNLILSNSDIAWADVKIKGTKAIITIVEKKLPPELDESAPCNIVASKKGIIEDIVVLRGRRVVEKGDLVEEGQIIISGFVDEEGIEPYLVHAKGLVKARVIYSEKLEVPLIELQETRTGRTSFVIKISSSNGEMDLKRIGPVFEDYDTEITRKIVLGWRNLRIPVELIIEKQYEVEKEKVFIGIEGAFKKGKDILEQRLKERIPESSIIKTKFFEKFPIEKSKALEVRVIVETIEEIGVKQKIKP